VAEERWTDFIEWACRARAKPTFDSEERDYRLAVAAAVRDLIQAANDGRPLVDRTATVLERVLASRHTIAPARRVAQLRTWAEEDEPRLARALRAFSEAGDDPAARLDRFVVEVERGPGDERLASGSPLVGSLLNFGTSPERLPLVRPAWYSRLRELLGSGPVRTGTVLERYRQDLAFAGTVERALREAGVPVRDMMDVDSLMAICATQTELWAGAGDAADSRRVSEPEVYLAVCMIYRNEANYLAEWIEFHLLVGVERFYLYDNESDDNHLEVLAPYLEQGIVVLNDWPGSSTTGLELNAVQMGAYEHCVSTRAEEARWIAVIDADEFLFSPTGKPVSELLTEYERWPAVAVNTRRFGASDHVTRPGGLVLENHTGVDDTWGGKLVKSIVDPSAVTRCINSHRFECRRGTTVDENGYPVFHHTTQSSALERLQINHYLARSEVELHEKHGRRVTDRPAYARSLPSSSRADATENRDEAILQYLAPLRAALRRRAVVPS
jgi:Glycosyltransferase family 92